MSILTVYLLTLAALTAWTFLSYWLYSRFVAVAGSTNDPDPVPTPNRRVYLTHIPGNMYANDARLQHWFDTYTPYEDDEPTKVVNNYR